MTPHLPEGLSTKIDWSPFVIVGQHDAAPRS